MCVTYGFYSTFSWVVVLPNKTRTPPVRMLLIVVLLGRLVDKPFSLRHLQEKHLCCPSFNMLVFKDQQREAVICMAKKFKEFTSWTVALLIDRKVCGLGFLKINNQSLSREKCSKTKQRNVLYVGVLSHKFYFIMFKYLIKRKKRI